nr:ABC transporter ATP-binding protein [Actinomycetales bacterium]
MRTGGPVLRIEHLAISFHQYERGLRRRTVTPVVDMSLEAYAGEVLAIVGESGAGKSLVGMATLGLLPPNAEESGVVRFHGRALDHGARRRLAGHEVGLLPQSPAFLDPLSRVGTQLRRAAKLAGITDSRGAASEALQRRGMAPSVMRLYPHELSGGMARRVLFALATMAAPQLIFADEPTPGLHESSAAEVLADIRGLADSGSAVILVSHDIDQALTIANRVVVVRAGRTLEQAVPSQFAGDGSALRHPYSRALWRALPRHGFELPAGGIDSDLPRPAAAEVSVGAGAPGTVAL